MKIKNEGIYLQCVFLDYKLWQMWGRAIFLGKLACLKDWPWRNESLLNRAKYKSKPALTLFKSLLSADRSSD